jgi:hypothetical protein
MSGRHRKPHPRVPGRHRKAPGPSRFLAPGLVVVALLGAGGVGAHAALSNSGSDSTPMPATLPQNASPSSGAVPAVSPAPTAVSTPSAQPAVHRRPVALRLVITGSVSWIEVRRPTGRVLVSGLIRHGHRLTYRHGPLDVVIGNAAAVQVTRHGATHRAGRPGEVVTLSVE